MMYIYGLKEHFNQVNKGNLMRARINFLIGIWFFKTYIIIPFLGGLSFYVQNLSIYTAIMYNKTLSDFINVLTGAGHPLIFLLLYGNYIFSMQ